MPRYDWVCDGCRVKTETWQSIHDPLKTPDCGRCGKPMRYVYDPNVLLDNAQYLGAKERRELKEVLGVEPLYGRDVDRILKEKGWERASGSRSYVRKPEPSRITLEEVKRIIDPPITLQG